MPPAFMRCIKSGGKVRTIKPSKGTYMAVCFKNGHSYHGEIHHNKPHHNFKSYTKKKTG